MLTHLIETQGLIGGLQPMRHKNSKRKRGPDTEDLEREDGSVRIDPERAQVPAKALILGKLSELSAWNTNFLSNLAAKTTRIVRANSRVGVTWRRPIPSAR